MSQKIDAKTGCLTLAAALTASVVLGYYELKTDEPAPVTSASEPTIPLEEKAWTACEEFTRLQLAHPAAADFDESKPLSVRVRGLGDGTFRCSGVVDAHTAAEFVTAFEGNVRLDAERGLWVAETPMRLEPIRR